MKTVRMMVMISVIFITISPIVSAATIINPISEPDENQIIWKSDGEIISCGCFTYYEIYKTNIFQVETGMTPEKPMKVSFHSTTMGIAMEVEGGQTLALQNVSDFNTLIVEVFDTGSGKTKIKKGIFKEISSNNTLHFNLTADDNKNKIGIRFDENTPFDLKFSFSSSGCFPQGGFRVIGVNQQEIPETSSGFVISLLLFLGVFKRKR